MSAIENWFSVQFRMGNAGSPISFQFPFDSVIRGVDWSGSWQNVTDALGWAGIATSEDAEILPGAISAVDASSGWISAVLQFFETSSAGPSNGHIFQKFCGPLNIFRPAGSKIYGVHGYSTGVLYANAIVHCTSWQGRLT